MALTKIDDRGLNTPIDLLDNEKIRFGTGNDLEIYHNGTNSWLSNVTGDINISNIHNNSDDIWIRTTDDFGIQVNKTENGLFVYANGSCELYYDNGKKFETTSTGTLVGGIIQAKQNSGNAAQTLLKLTNNDTTASGETGQTADIEFEFTDNTNTTYKAAKIGAYKAADWVGNVDYDAGLKFFTVNNSASFENTYTERLAITENGELKIPDNGKFVAGTGGDLEIWHNGTNSYIDNITGVLHLRVNTNENALAAVPNAEVALYYDEAKKFETTSAGVAVGGTGKATLHVKAHDNNWEAGLLLEDNTGNDGWNFHPESSDASLMIGYNDDTTAALTSQSATSIIRLRSAGGICFGSDTAAANALDDYEEGTWTPSATSGTFTTGTGTYTKIGRLVTAYFVIEVHSTTSGNYMQFNGLPFTNVGNAGENMSSIAYNETGNVMRIYVTGSGVAGLFWNDSTSFFTYANCSGDRIRGGVSYFA